MSVQVSVETVIERPVEAVFAYTTTVEHDPVWTSGLVEARMLTVPPFATGTRIERVSRFLGRRMVYVIDVVEVIEGERVTMHTSSGPFPMVIDYEYEAAEGGTRFRIRTSGEPGGFFGLASGLVSRAVERAIRTDLANLKDVLEAG